MGHALRVSSIIGLALVLLSACGSSQTLVIDTQPEGAEVYLQRRGHTNISAGVSGLAAGTHQNEQFAEEFYLIGTTPLTYEFDLDETDTAVHVPALGDAAVTRHFEDGTLRFERTGYQTIERAVRFNGDEITLNIALEPEEEGESGDSAPDDAGASPEAGEEGGAVEEEPSM
jgi:hypothetical protein